MKKSLIFFLLILLIPFSIKASQYIDIKTEEDLPRVAANIRHFLETESENIESLQKEEDFSNDVCKKIVLGRSFIMSDFRISPKEFKIQLKETIAYVIKNQSLIEEKMEKTEIDSLMYGLWVIQNVVSKLK